MATSDETAITVYFDGQCPVCNREVALYRRLERRGRIAWCDLAGPGEPLQGEAFTLSAALELLHAKDAEGVVHVGLDAHLLMWQRLPGWRALAWMLRRWPTARKPVEALYLTLTKRRPGLVRRRAPAGDGRG